MAFYQLGDAYVRQAQWDEHRRAAEVDLDEPVLQRALHPAGQGLHEEGPARHRRGHAAPRDRVRPEQQARTTCSRSCCSRPAGEEAKQRVRDRRAAAGTAGTVSSSLSRARPCVAARGCCAAVLCLRSPTQSVQSPSAGPVDVHRRRRARRAARSPAIYGGVERKRFIIETNGAGVGLRRLRQRRLARRAGAERHAARGRARREATWTAGGPRRPAASIATTTTARSRTSPTRAGLRRTGWASGVCAGDYDNDGWLDLFVTYYGQNVLYRNRRRRRFEDATRAGRARRPAGRAGARAARFVDYDRDGRPRSLRRELPAVRPRDSRRAGQGRQLPRGRASRSTAARKDCPPTPTCSTTTTATGTFSDVSAASGIAKVTGRYPMTALAADLDGDGWTDIYVACDSTAAILYRNNHDGTFTDVALESGAAYSENGNAQAGMGARASATTTATAGSTCSRRTSPTTSPRSTGNLGSGLFEDVADRGGPRRAEPLRRVGRRHARPRQRRPCRHLSTSPATSIPKSSASCRSIPHRGPRVVFRNRRRRPRSTTSRRRAAGRAAPALEPRRRVRRLRQRRRRRRAGDEHERAAVAAAQRLPRRATTGSTCSSRARVEPGRDRRTGRRHGGRPHAGARRAQPVELLLARRPAAALRPRRRDDARDRSSSPLARREPFSR